MTDDLNDDLYDEGAPPAQRVGNGPATKAPPTKMDNITGLASGAKTGKVLMVTAGAVLFVAGLTFVMFTSRGSQAQPLPAAVQGANVGSPPALNEAPSAALANSQQYNEMIDEVNRERVEAAKASGQSVQPLAEATFRDLKPAPTLEQLAQQQAAGAIPPPQAQAPQPSGYQQTNYQQAPNPQDPAVQAQYQNAQQAIAALIAPRQRGMETFIIAEPARASQAVGDPSGVAQTAGQAGRGVVTASAQTAPTSYTLIQAGTVESVRLDSAINTDLAGDFVGTLVTGLYAGSKVVGTSRRTGTLAGLQFRSLSLVGQGVTIPITATGIDAHTLEPGTATDVDRKLMTKYVLKPLAAGVAAVGEAVKNSGTTVIVNGGSTVQSNEEVSGKKAGQIAVGAAAGQVSTDAEALDTTPTVRVAPGAIVGIMFTSDVVYTPRQSN